MPLLPGFDAAIANPPRSKVTTKPGQPKVLARAMLASNEHRAPTTMTRTGSQRSARRPIAPLDVAATTYSPLRIRPIPEVEIPKLSVRNGESVENE